jgi:glutathione S-transferase
VFDRYFRAHQNTLEQLVIFVPSMLIFSRVFDPRIAAGLGVVFIVGRALYFRGYVADAAKRGTGFLIGALAQVALLLGSLVGAGMLALGI